MGCEKEKSMINRLRERIKYLNAQLALFKNIQKRVGGITGEDFIQGICRDGFKTEHNASYDFLTKNRKRIEVKKAQCLPVNNRSETPCYRWAWRYVIRTNKKRKYYDYLLLIGDKDKRYRQNDIDKSPYVFFFLSYEEAKKLLPSNGHRHFNLTTNFATVRSKQGRSLIDKYRKSRSELIAILRKL